MGLGECLLMVVAMVVLSHIAMDKLNYKLAMLALENITEEEIKELFKL